MLRSRLERGVIVALVLACGGCSAETDDKAPTPHKLPVFDGQPRSHLITASPLKIDPGPDADELFARVMACYPARSLFRAELHAEARTGKIGGGLDGSGANGPGAGVVLRVPLWSALGFQAGTAENSVVCDRDPPAGRLTTDATVELLAAV